MSAERLDAFPERIRRSPGGKWLPYLDGSIWRIPLSDHPNISDIGSMRSSLYIAASERGLKARVHLDGDAVIVQAYEPDAS